MTNDPHGRTNVDEDVFLGLAGRTDPDAPVDDPEVLDRIARVARDVRQLLVDLGEDPEREGLRDTPMRVAKMYVRELLVGRDVTPEAALSTVFQENHRELVLVRDIPFYALCEHHMMPFFGRAHVGYVPSGAVVGISKLARLVEAAARRLTIQERITTQVADALMQVLEPDGAMVVVEAEHFCMTMRGVQKPGTITTTSAVRGIFASDAKARDEFLRLVRAS